MPFRVFHGAFVPQVSRAAPCRDAGHGAHQHRVPGLVPGTVQGSIRGTGNPASPTINNSHLHFTENTFDTPVNAILLENVRTGWSSSWTRSRHPGPFPSLPPTLSLCPALATASAAPCQDQEPAQKNRAEQPDLGQRERPPAHTRGCFLGAVLPARGAGDRQLNETFGVYGWITPGQPALPTTPSAERPAPSPGTTAVRMRGCRHYLASSPTSRPRAE